MFKVKGWYSEKKTNWTAARAGAKHGRAGIEPMADLVSTHAWAKSGSSIPTATRITPT
jgi:hypothetical protein